MCWTSLSACGRASRKLPASGTDNGAAVQLVEQEFSDVLDSAMFAASSWVANAPPTDVLRMRNLEIVESALTKDAEPESSADAVRAGMASKPVSVRPDVHATWLYIL